MNFGRTQIFTLKHQLTIYTYKHHQNLEGTRNNISVNLIKEEQKIYGEN
jgi:hypothetical protein